MEVIVACGRRIQLIVPATRPCPARYLSKIPQEDVPMLFLHFWQGRTGRIPYLAALVISSAAIAVLPYIAGNITIALAAGTDPALSILRLLIRWLLLGTGLFVTGGPLVFFARRRMRELGLSGVWLLL